MAKQQDQIAGIQRTILDNLNTAVLLLDPKLCIQYLNPSAESLFHISNQRAKDMQLDRLIFVNSKFMC